MKPLLPAISNVLTLSCSDRVFSYSRSHAKYASPCRRSPLPPMSLGNSRLTAESRETLRAHKAEPCPADWPYLAYTADESPRHRPQAISVGARTEGELNPAPMVPAPSHEPISAPHAALVSSGIQLVWGDGTGPGWPPNHSVAIFDELCASSLVVWTRDRKRWATGKGEKIILTDSRFATDKWS